jgi:ribonuclease J
MGISLDIIPLGGLGEFGMNCAILRVDQEMILIDAGVMFPGHDLLGVDVIVPDISFLRENRHQLKAILLTHGHEDHMGAISYVINEIPVPVYGSRLTLGLVAQKLKERGLLKTAQLYAIESRQSLDFGAFQVEPLHVTHSFPDAFCFAITTPAGTVLWTGDFKFDQTPIDGNLSDLHRLSEYGERGVLALFSDSTNSEHPGLAPSEFSVLDPLRDLFRKARKKIVVACFASSIHRIQIVLDLAREFGRKVVPVGRSMISNTRVAMELGYLRAPIDLLASVSDSHQIPPHELLVLSTGSQGEPMSALSRLAVDEFKNLKLEEEDMVILSARVIPGNEKLISNMLNHLYRRGAQVHDSLSSPVHVSGHGFRDDLKLMINLTRPRFFVPIHGEFRQLKRHALIARDQGIPEENIHIIENGEGLQISLEGASRTERMRTGRRFIDEGFLEEVHDMVLRDRRFLSEDGFLVVVLRVDRSSGELIGEPELISRGFVVMDDAESLTAATREEIVATVRETPVEEKQDEELFKQILRKRLKRFLRKQTGKRPMILPVMLEM